MRLSIYRPMLGLDTYGSLVINGQLALEEYTLTDLRVSKERTGIKKTVHPCLI